MNQEKEIHIICKLRAKDEHIEEVKKLLNEYVEPSRQEEGCLYYHIFQDRNDANAFFILDGWKDMEAVNEHVKHPNVIRVNALIEPLLDGKQRLTWGKGMGA